MYERRLLVENFLELVFTVQKHLPSFIHLFIKVIHDLKMDLIVFMIMISYSVENFLELLFTIQSHLLGFIHLFIKVIRDLKMDLIVLMIVILYYIKINGDEIS